jgi:putative PIN family toxin of toxin-antitoxin system
MPGYSANRHSGFGNDVDAGSGPSSGERHDAGGRRALSGEINLTVSQPILDEMADVLVRKFDATPDDVIEALLTVRHAARTIKPSVQLDIIKEDPPDNRILECAVSAGSDYTVTGDKDLPRLKQYDAIKILTVADFLGQIRGQARGF